MLLHITRKLGMTIWASLVRWNLYSYITSIFRDDTIITFEFTLLLHFKNLNMPHLVMCVKMKCCNVKSHYMHSGAWNDCAQILCTLTSVYFGGCYRSFECCPINSKPSTV